MKNDSNLFYTCSLIEYMSRQKKLRRAETVQKLGDKAIARVYRYADVLHCEPIEKVADGYEQQYLPEDGEYDNVKECRYKAPDYWTIGKVFSRLIEDVDQGDLLKSLNEVYTSWISDAISNYNTDLFYQPREYLKECYLTGEII